MPSSTLSTIDGMAYAQAGQSVQKVLKLGQLERYCSLVQARSGSVTADFLFGLLPEQVIRLDGELQVSMQVLCQRCLEPMSMVLHVPVKLLSAVVEQEQGLEDYEASEVLLSSELVLDELIEDELILGSSAHFMHETGKCSGILDAGGAAISPGPFDILRKLRS